MAILTHMSRLLFKWTNDGLIAANNGRPFTVGGLEALCASHRSDKHDGERSIFTSEQDALKKITDLRNSRLEAYQRCPGDIVEHARAEREMGLDYSNRLLLELMQNADDAAADKPIGYKGLGFKAVLDVADRVQISSRFLRVRFDREETRAAICSTQLPQNHEIPVLRLPFSDSDEFPAVEGEYDTMIFLRWNSPKHQHDMFAQEWKSVSENPSILLLLHSLEEVIWQPQSGERTVWRCPRDSTVLKLSIQTGKDEAAHTCWQILRDLSEKTRSAVVVPLDSDFQPRPYRHDVVRVFFPTEENSPVPLLLHGEFDLEQNRKHVRPGGNRAEVVQSLARCVRSVLSIVKQDGTVLDLLTPRIGMLGVSMLGLEREIWDAIKTNVADVILPESRLKIEDVRLCPDARGDFPWYSQQRLANWTAFKQLLQDFRPTGLTRLSLLPPGVDNRTRELVVCAFNDKAHLTLDELRQLSLFPVEGSETPLAAAECRLFFPHDAGESQPAPENIQIGFLRKDFAAKCGNQPEIKSFLERLGVSDFTPRAIADALSAQKLEAVNPEALWSYLLKVIAPSLGDSEVAMNWKQKSREALACRVKVPCRDGEWRPAIEAYAGREWTNDQFLERAYGSTRYFLSLPPDDEPTRKSFECLARWLGVGWSPKIIPIVNCEKKAGTREGARWRHGVFQVSQQPKQWQEHCNQLDRDKENDARKARLRQDWTVDGDGTVLSQRGAFESVVREWRNYENYLEAVVYRSRNKSEDYDDKKLWDTPSYVSHLFKNTAWIPTDRSDKLRAPRDIFVPGCEVHQSLPDWVFAPVIDASYQIKTEIGIRSSWKEIVVDDWSRWLTCAGQCDAKQQASLRQPISKLYAQALMKAPDGFRWFAPNPSWSIQKRPDNTEEWHLERSRHNVFFVDRPDLARLRLEAIRIFPVELGWSGNKQKVTQFFGVSLLSEHLSGSGEFKTKEPDDELPGNIVKRLHERTACLEAYLRTKGKDASAAAEKWKQIEFRTGCELKVTFTLDNHELEPQFRPTFFQTKTDTTAPWLWLDVDENFTDKQQPKDIVWEEVGAALCYTAGLALEDGAVFSALLGCGEDSLKRKLLNLGVTEAEIRAVVPQTVKPPVRQPSNENIFVRPAANVDVESLDPPETPPTEKEEPTLDEIAPAGDPLEKIREANRKLTAETPQRVETIVSRTVRNDTELVRALKELCEFRCQFPTCGKRIPKKGGGFYVEVHHVKPVAEGGPSVLGNLIVVCPNHHKEFEFGNLEIIEQTEELLRGKLNGIHFQISLPGYSHETP